MIHFSRELRLGACAFALTALPARAQTSASKDPSSASSRSSLPPLTTVLTGDPRADYDSALLLYQDGDFAGASLKFQRAYAASHDARLLWNAGAAEKSLRHYGRTYLLVSQYLREAGEQLSPAERDEAEGLLRTIESFVSHVTVTAQPDGVEMSVDDTRVATLPTTEPLVVDMGTRHFRFAKQGFREVLVTREVAGGAPTTLDARLQVDKQEGTLRVTAEPGNSIRVDGRVTGSGEWQGALSAGVHSVAVDGSERKPYRADVAIGAGQLTTLRVGLEPITEEKSKFVVWPWVAGGIAAIALIGVGTYAALAPDKSSSSPQPALGTVSPGYWSLHY